METNPSPQLASPTVKAVVRRVRDVLNLHGTRFTDEEVIKYTKGSATWQFAELYCACAAFKAELVNTLPKWIKRFITPNAPDHRRETKGQDHE